MKVAVLQMVSTGDLQDNLRTARALLEQAAAGGAELAVLPEYFCLIGVKDSDKLAIQEPFGQGPIQDDMALAARELGLWIVAGTLPLSASQPDHVFNSSLAFNPQGECVARYDKIHLFDIDLGEGRSYHESATIAAGSTAVVARSRSAPAAARSRASMRWAAGSGVITFSVAPAAGAVLTWSGSFYRRCRFDGDKLDTTRFLTGLWEAKRVQLISSRS